MRQRLARAATVLLLMGAGAMGATATSYADDSGWGTPPPSATPADSGWGAPAPSPTPEPTVTTSRDSGWG